MLRPIIAYLWPYIERKGAARIPRWFLPVPIALCLAGSFFSGYVAVRYGVVHPMLLAGGDDPGATVSLSLRLGNLGIATVLAVFALLLFLLALSLLREFWPRLVAEDHTKNPPESAQVRRSGAEERG